MKNWKNSPPKALLRDVGQVVLNSSAVQTPEPTLITNAHLDIFGGDLALEAFLQRKNGGVHGIIQLQILVVALLQEGFAIDGILAHRRGLPCEIRTGRIALEQVRAIAVPAANQQRHTEWPNAARLCVLLHECGNALHQLRHRNRFAVRQIVVLCQFAGLLHQQPIVGTHARVDHADVIGDDFHFVHTGLIVQNRLVLVLGGDDNTV